MKLFSSSRSRQRGIALVLAVLSLVILAVLAAGFIVGSITEHTMSRNEIDATAAVQLADGGVRATFQWLTNQNPPPCQAGGTTTPLGTLTVGQSGTTRPTLTWAGTNDCNNDYQGWGVIIQSTGTTPSGRSAIVEMRAKIMRKTHTCYAIYLGEECPMPSQTGWFADMDRVTGPVHSNCTLKLMDSSSYPWIGAQFWERVTISASAFELRPSGTSDPTQRATFYDGYETGVEPHEWPPSLAGTISCADLSHGGRSFQGETWLRFKSDGTVDAKNQHDFPAQWPNYVNITVPNGVIRVTGQPHNPMDIHVQGTYAGKWLIISQRHIIVDGDLIPNNDPRFGPSTDIMGLIPSEQAVGAGGKLVIPDVIPGYPNGIDGDRQLFAYVMVPRREGSWEVRDLSTRAREGILILLGGISFGYIGATETSDYLHGYGTDIWYDDRACEGNMPPPCFPDLTTQQGNRPVWTVAQEDSSWREVF